MNSIVTAHIMSPQASKIRKENVEGVRNLEMGAFTTRDENGIVSRHKFIGDSGKTASLVISGFKEFNLNNPTDKHNWEVLNIFKKDSGSPMADSIQLIDPNEEERANIQLRERKIEALNKVSEIKSKEESVKALYRRIVGPNVVIGSQTAYSKLLTLAEESPERFFINGKFIMEDSEFEKLSFVDSLIEAGVFAKGSKGEIRHSVDQRMYANSVSDAAFRIYSSDTELNEYKNLLEIQRSKASKPISSNTVIQSDLIASAGSLVPKDELEEDDESEETFKFDENGVRELVKELQTSKIISVREEGGITLYSEQAGGQEFEEDEFVAQILANEQMFNAYVDILKK